MCDFLKKFTPYLLRIYFPRQVIVFVITPLPYPSSAASRHFAPRLAQADGCTRALSENTQFSEMLRVFVKIAVRVPCTTSW